MVRILRPAHFALIFVVVTCFGKPDLLTGENNPCLRRTFVINASDSDGNPISNLSAKSLWAEFRGKPARIISLDPSGIRKRTVILLDESGSMLEPKGGWRFYRDLAGELVNHARQRGDVSLMTFASEARIITSFGTPSSVTLQSAYTLPTVSDVPTKKRKTAIWDAILAAQQSFKDAHNGDFICLVTDGVENASKSPYRSVDLKLLTHGTRLLVVVTPDLAAGRRGQLPMASDGIDKLMHLAKRSGGSRISLEKYWRLSGQEEIQNIVHELQSGFRKISFDYELVVEFSSSPSKPRAWKLHVIDSMRKARKVSINYPQMVMPCGYKDDAD